MAIQNLLLRCFLMIEPFFPLMMNKLGISRSEGDAFLFPLELNITLSTLI